MPNFAALEAKKTELIRKSLGGSLFIGDSTAAVITALTGTDSLLAALPATGGGYTDGGLMTDDGMRMARAVEQSEVTSFGQYEPTRSDITSDSETLEVDFQETSKRTISLFTGADPAGLAAATSSGEIKIVKPSRPSPRTYRILALSVDGPPEAEIYIAKFLPKAKVSDYADQAFAKSDDAIQWGCTFRAERDSAVGASVVYFFGGVGWKALLVAMGFPAAPV